MVSQIIHGAWVGNFRLVMALESGAVNIAANTTVVNSKAYIESRNNSSFYGYSTQIGHALNEQIVNSYTTTPSIPGNSQILISDVSRAIPHNANGTKTVTTSASFNNAHTGALHASGSMALPTIPRASTALWAVQTPAPEFGETRGLVLNRASSAFTHDITWTCGKRSGVVGTGVGNTVDFPIPLDLAKEFPNSDRGQLTFTTVTKNGTAVVGTRSSVTTILVPTNVVPSITGVRWTDTNPVVATAIGAFVQGLSTVTGAIDAIGAQGSEVSTRSFLVEGTRVPVGTPIQLNTSGSINVQAEVVDSRGRTASGPGNLAVLPYSPPSLGSGGWKVSRANSANVATELGTYLRLELDARAHSLMVGVQKNSLTIKVFTRPAGGGAWVARNVIRPGLTHNGAIQVSGGAAYPVTESFDVKVELSDNTGIAPTLIQTTIPTATVTLDMRGVNVGIGKYHQRGTLDVGGVAHAEAFHSDTANYSRGGIDSPPGTVVDFAGSTPPLGWLLCTGQAVSRATYSELYAVIGTTYGAGDGSSTFNLPDARGRVIVGRSTADTEFSALGSVGGAKTHTLTIEETAPHTHGPGNGTNFTNYQGSGGQIGHVAGGSLNFSLTTKATGGGKAHNNLQPYITMNRIIRT